MVPTGNNEINRSIWGNLWNALYKNTLSVRGSCCAAVVFNGNKKGMKLVAYSLMQQNSFTEEKVELRVLDWLAASGYQLIKQNWQCCQDNIDIIASYANQLHFIGVTTKKYPDNGLSCRGITRRRILSFLQASQQYMKRNPQWKEVIIDVLTVTMIREEPRDCVMTENIRIVC